MFVSSFSQSIVQMERNGSSRSESVFSPLKSTALLESSSKINLKIHLRLTTDIHTSI